MEDVLTPRPPTEADDFTLPPEPPAWPKVIGAISIALGSLALVCGGVGLAFSIFVLPDMLGVTGTQDLPPSMQPDPLMWAVTILSFGVEVLLIVAGIATLLRLIAGRWLHLLYAAARIGFTIWGMYYAYTSSQEMTKWVADNPDSPFAQNYNETFQLISAIAFSSIGLLWPVFCLIWFGLVKRTKESMTGGLEQTVI